MAVSRLSQTTLQNAFQKYNNLWDGTSAVGSMDALGAVYCSAATSSITFSSIPQTYTHLHIRGIMRDTYPSDNIIIKFNNDSGSNYSWHVIRGTGSVNSTANNTSTTGGELGWTTYSGLTANFFSGLIIDIPEYTNTNKNKTTRSFTGVDVNLSAGYVTLGSSMWRNTAAITTITITMGVGNFDTYSSIALYGVK